MCWDGIPIEMGWDGIETFISVPPPITIPSSSSNFLIPAPYHTISPNCSHPTHHAMIKNFLPSQYHHTSASHLSHVHTNTIIVEIHTHRSTGSTEDSGARLPEKGAGRALDDVEKIFLLLDPRFKSLCTAVCCLNGENGLQNEVRALMEYKFSTFSGMLLSGRGASAPVAVEMSKAREAPKQERQAPKAREGGRGAPGWKQGPRLLCPGWTISERT